MTTYFPQCWALVQAIFDRRGFGYSPVMAFNVRPKSCTVSLNGYSEADTWDLSFDARVFPVDPNLLASVAVRIYMMDAQQLAVPEVWALPDYEMIVGLADDSDIELSSDGRTVHMSGRDYTALLLDSQWDPRKRIPSGRPLSETVQSIVDAQIPLPSGLPSKSLTVVFDSDAADPIVGAAHRQTKKKGFQVKPGKDSWSVIYDMCLREGMICYVKGEQLIITEPRVQLAKSMSDVPRLVYGTNLDTLRASRHLGKERIPQIVATSRDPRTGKIIEAKYPKNPAAAPPTGIGTARNEIHRVTAPPGIIDLDTLQRFARTVYDNRARSEAKYNWSTPHMRDTDNRDLLRLEAGLPMRVEWDAFNAEEMRQLDAAQRLRFLRKLGYSQEIAQLVAQGYDLINQFSQPYYTKTVTYTMDADSGMRLEGEIMNYAYVGREENVQ